MWCEKPDHRHRRLLRARRQRPRRRRAAEQRDEFAPLHSITSSASESTIGGIVKPSVRAVEELTNSLRAYSPGQPAGPLA